MLKALKVLFIAVGFILAVAAGFLAFVVVTDYMPEDVLVHDFDMRTDAYPDDEISVVTFNIGYCGLDKGQDFFMDGGKGSRSESFEKTKENLEAVVDIMKRLDADVYMLQEVDINSRRSFGINQKQYIKDAFEGYSSSFVYNYISPWVPLPVLKPMGKVESGLLTLLNTNIKKAVRMGLPEEGGAVDKYFMLDRCIDVISVKTVNGRNLSFINLHLSAYDKGGLVKKEQMKFLKEYIQGLDPEGYYVFGGDWNQLLSENIKYSDDDFVPEWLGEAPTEFDDLPFSFAYDDSVNTVRDLYEPYDPGSTFETVIDGFLIGNNIEVLEVETIDEGFVYSDHNPVRIKIRLK